MNGCALHVQAGIWQNHHEHAVLFMEGEAPDRTNGGGLIADALYRVVLARGLRITTDLDHIDPRPVHGWKMCIDPEDSALTLQWPRFRPLLEHAPVDLPEGWLPTALNDGHVLLFAGYSLGMWEHAADGDNHPAEHLQHVAELGMLAAGVIPVTTAPPPAQHL